MILTLGECRFTVGINLGGLKHEALISLGLEAIKKGARPVSESYFVERGERIQISY